MDAGLWRCSPPGHCLELEVFNQTRKIGLVLAASVSVLTALAAAFILLPKGVGVLATWQLGLIVGLCVLPALTAMAMSADNAQRRP